MDTAWYYKQELHQLRTLAAEFAKKHPEVAPLLDTPSCDPDVERLLEGTAYLSGLLSQKIEESYDHIAESLCTLVLPQIIRGIPSCTMIQFTPQKSLIDPLLIPKGSRVGSKDIDGITCVFTTTSDVTLLPLSLDAVQCFKKADKNPSVDITFALKEPHALRSVKKLRIYFSDKNKMAAHNLFSLLFYTKKVHFSYNDGEKDVRESLTSQCLHPVGFESEDELFPLGETDEFSFRILQEYYTFPQKFFFLDVDFPSQGITMPHSGLLTISLELAASLPEDFPNYDVNDFSLFTTPAVNVFPFDSRPIKADLKQAGYTVYADCSRPHAYVPYKVNKVTEVSANGDEREYTRLLSLKTSDNVPSYTVRFPKKSDGQREMQIVLMHSPDAPLPAATTLSLDVLYSNGMVPHALGIGDIDEPLTTSSVLMDFINITAPTKPMQSIAEGNIFWSMLSHLHLNYLPLAHVDTLKAMLMTYIPTKFDDIYINVIKQHINSILSVEAKGVDVLWKGRPQRSTEMTVLLDVDGFNNAGSMYFFGAIVARFLHERSPLNSFMRVIIKDSLSKRCFQWQKHQKAPCLL